MATTKLTLPWKVRLSIFVLSALSDASRRSNGTFNRRIFNLVDRKAPPNPNVVNGVYSSDVTVDPSRNLWFRLFIPSISSAVSAASLPVFVYFHGGAFTFFNAASIPIDAFCRLFCRSLNAVVVSVDYRLTPEHRYPSQYDDGHDVLKFLDQNSTVLPSIADVSKCFLAGDSAGANLAHHVAVRVCEDKLRTVKIIGLVSVQPYFGGEERTGSELRLNRVPVLSLKMTDWHWKVFLPNGSDRDHGAANVSGPNTVDISGLDYPNTIVFLGGLDLLRDWQMKYYEWLRKSGKGAELVDYPNAFHGFYLFPELPLARLFFSRLKEFVTKQISNMN
ncbi:probable carboxylesterase 18 [Vigna unguiculata]|uniref:Gibberellin receptor GID1 n=1 Tax=Vigna unguiculata TaxID=3917 RepID=A0A4D6M1J8_VIGUN|nr:probable carboxylesterase 18 [Vigna unguiculata]QCD95042.1 gibberellin receptor GID1 [Vigna unguiculata]